MANGGYVVLLALLLLVFSSVVSADSVDDEFKKIANYAREYETGNIDYVQLLIYSSAVREKMNEVLGVTGKEMGGILKQEQIKKILGEPVEETKWVWSEKEEKEIRLDNVAPVWKKIIFDGRKIQIRLNAWPSIFSKREFKENEENKDEKSRELEDLEGKLVYRLNFEIEFKKPEEQLDIQGRIDKIQALAQNFNSNPSSENAETLAKESVNAERTFESYFRQNGGKCEDTMGGIFGTENKRQTQHLFVQEVSFCEGDNYEVIARLEMCDECEWNWIGIDFRVERRGPGFKPEEEKELFSPKSLENMNAAELEEEVKKTINEIKRSCDNKDFKSIINLKNKLWPLNDAWNQKSNDVWKEVDKTFKTRVESMTQEQRQEFDQNYGWIKQEQEKRKRVKELSKANYESRKQFYLNLFSDYDKKEYYFTQVEFQKRLVEEFKERGEEICDNNRDDNENEAIDCADDQCGGKICGRGNIVQENNVTIESNLYCIERECKAKEEIQEVVRNVSMVCPELLSVECSEGNKVFFSRYDNQTNCPIETSCLEETESCEINEDCRQPACGIAECVENKCKVAKLTECRELECIDGDEKICESDGRIVEICRDGFWEKTGECEEGPRIRDNIIIGNECLSADDCGSDNVCNNGMCQMLPKVIIAKPAEESLSEDELEPAETNDEPEETQPRQEEQQQAQQPETQEQEPNEPEQTETNNEIEETQESGQGTTGNVIFNLIGSLFSKIRITGAAITGFDIEENVPEPETSSPEQAQESEPAETNDEPEETQPRQEEQQQAQQPDTQEQQIPPENQKPSEDWREDDRNREDEQRRREENKERCKKDCNRPCIERCIRDECGEELECVIDEAQKKCEGTCQAGEECVEKCTQGGDWWEEFENKDEHKEEKGVFQVGGSCRTNQGKTEGFIWFGGWGEPFQRIQGLKNKYYSGGQADWCKYDLENLKKQRQEFEKGFNQEFTKWFFEKYLANSAENWEQSVSGIFELYWRDVDNSREMVHRMQCLGTDELPNINLINVRYDAEYGNIEFWEEIKTAKLEGMDKEVKVISPYMKIWVFPSKEFIISEMKLSMENHEFPGSPEEKMQRKNEEGPTAEEREMIKQDEKFMSQIRKVSEKYDGNLDAVIRFIDDEIVVFNLYVQVNENDIIKFEPMLPEEVPQEDIKIEIKFQKLYDIIYMQEKEMQGQRIESPPWDKKTQPIQKVKDTVNGIKMYFKVRDMMNSAEIYPKTSEKDVKTLMKSFFSMMMRSEKGPPNMEKETSDDIGKEKGVWEEKGKITGEIILD